MTVYPLVVDIGTRKTLLQKDGAHFKLVGAGVGWRPCNGRLGGGWRVCIRVLIYYIGIIWHCMSNAWVLLLILYEYCLGLIRVRFFPFRIL